MKNQNHPAVLLGKRIKYYRNKTRYTMGDMAHGAGMTLGEYSNLEFGIGKFPTKAFLEVARCLKIDISHDTELNSYLIDMIGEEPLKFTDVFEIQDIDKEYWALHFGSEIGYVCLTEDLKLKVTNALFNNSNQALDFLI